MTPVFLSHHLSRLLKTLSFRGKTATGAKAQPILIGLRGPEGPLFRGSAGIREFFSSLLVTHFTDVACFSVIH
jgi:hypothetical protein